MLIFMWGIATDQLRGVVSRGTLTNVGYVARIVINLPITGTKPTPHGVESLVCGGYYPLAARATGAGPVF